MKTCSWCQKEKPLSEFSYKQDGRDGREARCTACLALDQKKYRKVSEKKNESPGKKICSKCKIEKPLTDFTFDQHRRDGYCNRCRECTKKYNKKENRNHQLAREYGITEAHYELMLKSQNGVCAICGQPETMKLNDGQSRRLSVDHCHKTQKVRGLLCHSCNVLLGSAKDSVELLQQAIKYLEKQK